MPSSKTGRAASGSSSSTSNARATNLAANDQHHRAYTLPGRVNTPLSQYQPVPINSAGSAVIVTSPGGSEVGDQESGIAMPAATLPRRQQRERASVFNMPGSPPNAATSFDTESAKNYTSSSRQDNTQQHSHHISEGTTQVTQQQQEDSRVEKATRVAGSGREADSVQHIAATPPRTASPVPSLSNMSTNEVHSTSTNSLTSAAAQAAAAMLTAVTGRSMSVNLPPSGTTNGTEPISRPRSPLQHFTLPKKKRSAALQSVSKIDVTTTPNTDDKAATSNNQGDRETIGNDNEQGYNAAMANGACTPYSVGSSIDQADGTTSVSHRRNGSNNENSLKANQQLSAASTITSLRKRNLDFHALFPTVPVGEILVDDYNCAMQKEILVQGRLYISERNVCFYANIFGWVTNLIIPFSQLLAVEKRNTAFVIPNAIQLASTQGRFFFTSFLFRDSAYTNLVDTWKRCRAAEEAVHLLADDDAPENAPNEYGSPEDQPTASPPPPAAAAILPRLVEGYQSTFIDGYVTNNASQEQLSNGPAQGVYQNEEENDTQEADEDGQQWRRGIDSDRNGLAVIMDGQREVLSDGGYTETEQDDNGPSTPFSRWRKRIVSSRNTKPKKEERVSTPLSADMVDFDSDDHLDGSEAEHGHPAQAAQHRPRRAHRGHRKTHAHKEGAGDTDTQNKSAAEADTLPVLDADVSCDCSQDGTHDKEQQAVDTIIEAPLPVVFKTLFGNDIAYMTRFHTDDQKNKNVKYGEWHADEDSQEVRDLFYEIPIRNPLGPKITRANIVERLLHKDLTNYVTILSKVNTPDVPQGSNFHSLTRVCMMRCAQPNRTRIRVTCKVEWQKSTWLKGPIEKGVMEGNQGFYRALFEDVKRYLKSPQPAVNAVGTVGQDLYQRRRRGSRAHGPGDRSRNLAEGDTLLDASKIAAHNTSTSGTTEDTSVFDAFFGWFTPIRILGLFVVALCIAINIWCWYQLTGPSTHLPSGSTYLPPTTQRYTRNQEYEQTSHLGYSNDYIDTEKKPISSQFDETMRTGDAMDRLLAFLSKLRHTHETSPDSQLYLAEMDDLQQRLLMSYNRFRQLDLRVIELTRKIVDTDRELRRLMHAVEAERAVLMDEMDHIVSVYNVPPTPTDQTAASSSQTTSETVFGAEETTTSKADTSVRQEKEATTPIEPASSTSVNAAIDTSV